MGIIFDKIYPLTIVCDRYGGAYSGAQYLAFNLDPDCIPDAVGAGDIDEMEFWMINKDYEKYDIGKGKTVQEAHDNLKEIILSKESE